MKLNTITLAALTVAASSMTHAAPIDPFNITAAAGCGINSSTCSVNWQSQIYTPNLAAVQINRSTGSSWLVRYDLHSPSAFTSMYDYEESGNYDTSVTSYTGNIWVEAPEMLNFGNLNNFNVYTDQVDQNPGTQGSELYISNFNVGMTAADAIAGSASYYNSGSDGEFPPTTSGSLTIYNDIFTCIECGIDVTLNLAGLDYTSGQLLINPFMGPQEQLFSFSDSYDYFNKDREFFVSAVPVPAAFWLFASGLIGLANFSRSKKS
jgi:hypothetical protein